MTGDFTYQWRTDVHRNPGQLLHNRGTGKLHPPALRTGNIWWAGPEMWTVHVFYGDCDRQVLDYCASFLDAVAYLDAEYYEWRYVSTIGGVWKAERYQGGSGPIGTFNISGRRLSKRTRPYSEINDGLRRGGPGSNQYEIKPVRTPESGPDQGAG